MANVTYEGDNVLKYELDGPTEPLGPNENDRWCKSINGEAPDEVELWDRNDPGPEACCGPPLAMSSAGKPMKVKGQLEVEGMTGNPDAIMNRSFGMYSMKSMSAEPTAAVPTSVPGGAASVEYTWNDKWNHTVAAYWVGDPGVSGEPGVPDRPDTAVPMVFHAVAAPDDPLSEIVVMGHRRKRQFTGNASDTWDAGTY